MSDYNSILVFVHVRRVPGSDAPDDQLGSFDILLPARPAIGDWINVANQVIEWRSPGHGVVKTTFASALVDSGAPGAPAVLVEDVVFVHDDDSSDVEISVFGSPGMDPISYWT